MGGANATYTDNHPDCELNFVNSTGLDFGCGRRALKSTAPAARLLRLWAVLTSALTLPSLILPPPPRSFPYCHTGPAGNDADARPYNRLPGVGLNYPDPNLNANESVRKCNGAGVTITKAIQAMGPHTAPLGMVSLRAAEGCSQAGARMWQAAAAAAAATSAPAHAPPLPLYPARSASTSGPPAPTSPAPTTTPSSWPCTAAGTAGGPSALASCASRSAPPTPASCPPTPLSSPAEVRSLELSHLLLLLLLPPLSSQALPD